MAWTYSGDPSTSALDATRFIIGDTDTTDQLLSDGEVNYMIATHGASRHAASECCRAIAAKFARLMDRSIGGLSASFSAKYTQYLELAASIQNEEDLVPVAPFISGFSRAGKEAVENDTDREPTFGRKGVHDNPRSNSVDDYYPYGYRSL